MRLKPGDPVVVDTSKGQEFAVCVSMPFDVDETQIPTELKPVVRYATEADVAAINKNREQERDDLEICKQKIMEHGLDMKLIDVDYSLDGTKMTFHFITSGGRVDFRELVRDLAAAFRKRIDLRQIGVRDGARILGGLAHCGREYCCSGFLNDFQAISVRMAKNQGLSLNPVKISGACGNLMCCLKYEEDAYVDLQKDAPSLESIVDTPLGKGLVVDMNLLKRTVKVRVETSAETTQKTYPFAQISYTVGGVYHEATEIPALVEKAPAFEPPKYENLKYEDLLYASDDKASVVGGAAKQPRHERVREHNAVSANSATGPGSAARPQRPRNGLPKASNTDRDGEIQTDANFRKSNRRANDTSGHGGQGGRTGHRPNNRSKK
jgi:cell fate regulator YaaT (PSP1 superfamily)